MSQILHRSENLMIVRGASATASVELRFSTSVARGSVDTACPKCGALGKPEQWELEGPESRGNTVWFRCVDGPCAAETRWSRIVAFAPWADAP